MPTEWLSRGRVKSAAETQIDQLSEPGIPTSDSLFTNARRRVMNKYRNLKTTINGIVFDSKKEAERYRELVLLERTGEISNLKIQPRFMIVPKVDKFRARFYVADFQYEKDSEVIVEDVKSPITRKNPVYTLKRQLFLCQYGDQVSFRDT